VIRQGEPAPGRAAVVGEAGAGRRSTDVHPLCAATREAEGVVGDWYQPAPLRVAREDPWAKGGWGRAGSSPVYAHLVKAEVVSFGGQPGGDLFEEFGGERGPTVGCHLLLSTPSVPKCLPEKQL
jgi:hypothetical protein